MKNLILWYTMFAITFMFFIIVASVIGAQILTDVSAYNQCQGLPDEQFKICYTLAR